MGGLGLMLRRRAIQAHPTAGLNVKFYNRIVGDGKAYIITDYYPSNYDSVEIIFYMTSTGGMVLGERMTMPFLILAYSAYNTYTQWDTSSTVNLKWTPKSLAPLYVGMEISGGTYRARQYTPGIGDTDSTYNSTIVNYGNSAPAERVATTPLRVFASTADNSTSLDNRIFKGSIYSIKITDSRTGEIKCHLRPAEMDGEIGMYNVVSGMFFKNANTSGQFLADDNSDV